MLTRAKDTWFVTSLLWVKMTYIQLCYIRNQSDVLGFRLHEKMNKKFNFIQVFINKGVNIPTQDLKL